MQGPLCLFGSARAAYSSAMASFPTRHSRHLPPPVCRDALELRVLTQELLEVTFVPYTLSQEQDLWESNDATIQKAEYTIRGHAACVPGTLWYPCKNEGDSNNEDVFNTSSQQHVSSMQAIIDQLEEQNKIYMKVRTQLNSQVASSHYNEKSSSGGDDDSDSSDSNNDDDDNEKHATSHHTTGRLAAGPGPTVEMWDTLLDSMAVTCHNTTPAEFKSTLERVLLRHALDGGFESNTNPYTVPTVLTFNAVLRGVANVKYETNSNNNNMTKIRDEALETAFGVYDEMQYHVERNSATFQYMLQVVQTFLPPSLSRGNIAHGLWTHAKQHAVASSQVLQALHRAHVPSNGAEFDAWLEENNYVKKMPLKWRREHKMRRYNRSDATY